MEERRIRPTGEGAEGAAASRSARPPLVTHDPDACLGCLACVRLCPAKAMRVANGRVEVAQERCVRCGLCVSECGGGALRVRDDTELVQRLLASRRPVVALLATEFVAAMHPMTTPEVEHALRALGFYAVESTLLGEEVVAEQYEKIHARDDSLFVLRSTCPVVVDWVRRYHPEFVSALAPIVPSYIAQARLTRAVYAEDIAIVYVSPCYARKEEAMDRQFDGVIDACIDFLELRRLIEGQEASGGPEEPCSLRTASCRESSLPGGFPRLSLASRSMLDNDLEVVRGLRDIERLLRAIQRGETGPRIIDMTNCEGCIDGPAVSPGLSVFAKRNIEAAERETAACASVSTRSMLRLMPAVDLVRSFRPEPVLVPLPDPQSIDELLDSAGMSRETTPDCGACGSDTCVEHAIAVHRGDATWDVCLPLQRRLLAESRAQLAANATTDQVTGFLTRRIVSERLAEEVARGLRQRVPVSLLLIRVDALDSVAEVDGPEAVEAVLGEVADAVAKDLRTGDICGAGGERVLSLVLPGTDKTSAFAVGEKLRSLIAAHPVTLPGYRERAGRMLSGLTVSIGVATAGTTITEPEALLEAADGALRQAVDMGGDQVRLAPG